MIPEQLSLFKPIAPAPISWTRWAISVCVHVAAIAILAAIPAAMHHAIEPANHLSVHLIDPTLVPPVSVKVSRPLPAPAVKIHETIDVRKLPPIAKPKPVEALKIEPPRIETPKIEPPKIEAVHIPEPKFEVPAPLRPPVKTDVFAANAPLPMGAKAAAHDVKLGGFGDPNGVPASATASGKGLTVAKVGAFDLPVGSGEGGAGGRGRVVASAGFGSTGSGGPSTGTGPSRGIIHPAGFNEYQPNPAATRIVRASAPAETPVEILYKPKPVYTPEAREKKVEGEVQLDVVFGASGQIHVLRVVRGLGLGLDESAKAAASQIRFRPGTRDGNPIDMHGIVHIVFELS